MATSVPVLVLGNLAGRAFRPETFLHNGQYRLLIPQLLLFASNVRFGSTAAFQLSNATFGSFNTGLNTSPDNLVRILRFIIRVPSVWLAMYHSLFSRRCTVELNTSLESS